MERRRRSRLLTRMVVGVLPVIATGQVIEHGGRPVWTEPGERWATLTQHEAYIHRDGERLELSNVRHGSVGRVFYMHRVRGWGSYSGFFARMSELRRVVAWIDGRQLPRHEVMIWRDRLAAHTGHSSIAEANIERERMFIFGFPSLWMSIVVLFMVAWFIWIMGASIREAIHTVANRPDPRVLALGKYRCPECRYDIRTLPQRRCPQCGGTWSEGEEEAAMAIRARNPQVPPPVGS